jgi:hypothetical protein
MARRKRVKSLSHLQELALARKAVWVTENFLPGGYRVPAAFAINWQGWWLLRCFTKGMYEYQPKQENQNGRE